MDKPHFRLAAGILLSLSLLHTCRCQPNTLFNQSPFQRQPQSQQLRQQLQQQQQQQQQQRQQQNFPGALNALNPLPPLSSPLSPLSPIVPQSAFRTYNRLNPQNYVPITAYQNEINYDGSFSYGYASADGTTAQAQGYVKNLGLGEDVEAQVVQGSYSYTSPEGTPITVRYIADENGFRAEGAHIPTPPPVPDAIAKSLQYIASVQPYQQVINPNLNPYQTPFRQYPSAQNFRPGQQLTPLQLQQQRLFQQQQQQNVGQYQPQYPFNAAQQPNAFLAGNAAAGQFPGNFGQQQQPPPPQQQPPNQQNFTQQQQSGQQEQQQHQQQQQQQKQQQQQQQLATQQLRGRPNQLLDPYGYNQNRRYKKATKT